MLIRSINVLHFVTELYILIIYNYFQLNNMPCLVGVKLSKCFFLNWLCPDLRGLFLKSLCPPFPPNKTRQDNNFLPRQKKVRGDISFSSLGRGKAAWGERGGGWEGRTDLKFGSLISESSRLISHAVTYRAVCLERISKQARETSQSRERQEGKRGWMGGRGRKGMGGVGIRGLKRQIIICFF